MSTEDAAIITADDSLYVFGIDLGTTNSAIAVYVNGRAEILPIDNQDTLPSVVSVRDDGEVLVGRQARNRILVDPQNTVASVKREMGGEWKREFKGRPGTTYTPVDISAFILERLKNGADQSGRVDLNGTPKDVVICVPANFNDVQKTATRKAAELAGLNVLWLLEEPIAAAIAYALDRERDQTILVYDLGGGTFDVSILHVDSTKPDQSQLKVLAKDGVQELGGDDFDYVIMELGARQLQADCGIDIMDLKKDQGVSVSTLREAQQKLKLAAETAKRELTDSESAPLQVPNLVKDESGNLHSLDLEITRSQFEECIRPLLIKSQEAVQRALDSAGLTAEGISRIVLVGGSTRVPLVREELTKFFGREPWSDTNPDVVVARGAALFGGRNKNPRPVDGESVTGTQITDVVSHYLGLEVVGGRFSCVIEKGAEIPSEAPYSVTRGFSTHQDDMTELAIRVYQANELQDYVGTEGTSCIGEFFVPLPPKPAGQERVQVTFAIDQQNLLQVSATSSTSSEKLDIRRS